ncbi:MAG: zinc-ribbon domain-containing protein [Candidatus Berkelbacteria bacterium]|nr:zinc-ribbon domain-containing protein [Candidatus Berkelbacteria bacterium]
MTTNVNIEDLADKSLYCKDCGNKFIWTAGEQKFFLERGLQNMPKRCKICTAKNREKLREKHPLWWIKCRVCGKKNEVPFEPLTEDTLCEECFIKETAKRDQKLADLGEKFDD